MTDPVASAVTRAIARIGDGLASVSLGFAAEVGADEALKPIRDLVEICKEFGDELDIDDLEELIYPTKELDS